MSLCKPSSMEDLPVEVMVDILSRLPVKTIIHCKCVCKKWLNLVSDSHFAKLHLLRSPASLMIHHNSKIEIPGCHMPGVLKWMEVEDELDHHHLHHDPVMSLDLDLSPTFQNSQIHPVGLVNGLVCLSSQDDGSRKDKIYICNPITREYMILPTKQYYREGVSVIVYCFGFGSLTREFKVIRILRHPSRSIVRLLEAEVYTLGMGNWRSLGLFFYLLKGFYGPFLNGHAHWIVVDKNSPEKICAFDFDNETFRLFPSPPVETIQGTQIHFISLGVLKGCLCQCDTFESKFTIWVMKEYGIKTSWHKEFVIEENIDYDLSFTLLKQVYVIEGLKDGTVLMASNRDTLFVYCPRRKTIVHFEDFDGYFKGFAYRPSFHRLWDFENERVHVF